MSLWYLRKLQVTYCTGPLIFVRIWYVLLSNNYHVCFITDLKKNVHQDLIVTKNYTPKRKMMIFEFPLESHPNDDR